MPFTDLDANAIARSLSQIADRTGDHADAFFERSEILEVPPVEESCGARSWQREGFAIRLLRDGSTWLASRDRIESALFADATRQVARVLPPATYSPPKLRVAAAEPDPAPTALLEFPRQVERAIRRRLAGFPLRLGVSRYRRWVRVVDTRVGSDQQRETFFSVSATTPWTRCGWLLSSLEEAAIEAVATDLTLLFRARDAPAAERIERPVVLGPAAAAVLLHEAVAHALETDTLMLSGRVESAIGLQLGSALLDVLDTPGDGPPEVRRSVDDEGSRIVRRWLLRQGVVEQPLADLFSARNSAELMPGAGRRSDYHQFPVPRSSHLELLAGRSPLEELLSEMGEGYFLPRASRGSLDPLTGDFEIAFPHGRRVRQGQLDEMVGACRLTGRVADLLAAVRGVGCERESTGAGWCAKGGIRVPVWATTPALLLDLPESSA